MTDRAYPFALPLGTEISGYVIDKVIGAGGFGITYRGHNPVTGVTVAIKEFYPQGFASRDRHTVILHSDVSSGSYETALKKFEQEAAKLTGRYRHPQIVRGLNFLRMNNTAYFVMDFISGRSFDQWLLERSAPPDEYELRAIFDRVFDAVDYIHAQNGMHRDLTPRNIMISDEGDPVLVDFGAAGEGLDTDRFNSTAFAQPNYAPPEQLAAEDSRMQGRHTDIFSLGGVLYRAVVGRPPVKPLKRSHDVALNGRDRDPYVSATEAAREPLLYSAVFLTGIDHALKLDPRERPASISDFRASLGWLDDATMMVPEPPVDVGDDAEDSTRLLDISAGEPITSVRPVGAAPRATPTRVTGGGERRTGPTGPGRVVPRMTHDEATVAPVVALAPDEVRSAARGWGRAVAAVVAIVVALAAAWFWLGRDGGDPGTTVVSQRAGPGPTEPARTDPPARPQEPARTDPPAQTQAQPPAQPPADTPANWTEYANFALTGREIATRTVSADGYDACRQVCRSDGSCQGFVLANGNQCRTYAEVGGLTPDPGMRAAVRSGSAASTLVKASVDREARRRGQFRTIESVSLIGAGSPRSVTSQAQCAFACQSEQSCKAWVYMGLVNACRVVSDVDPAVAGPGVGFVTGVEDPDGKLSEAIRRSATAKTRTAQAFVGAELVGRVLERGRSPDGNACRQSCLANTACVASVQADGECAQFGQVDDIRRRPDAEIFADVRQTALVGRIDSFLKDKPQLSDTGRGQADFFAGFDVVGSVMPSDRARSAGSPEDCQAVCDDTNGCVAYTFSTTGRRCQVLGTATDVVPDTTRVSGIYRGVAQPVVDLARRRLVQSEQARANYRDLGPDCAPDGAGQTAALGSQPNAEQCAFLCRSGTSCQGWVYRQDDRSCRLLSSITGATTVPGATAGLFDPTGRRVADIGRACGPTPPAGIAQGGGPVPGTFVPPATQPGGTVAGGPVPPAGIGASVAAAGNAVGVQAAATDCDRLAGYLYDADLPRSVPPKQFEHIDPSRAVPACMAQVAANPNTARWKLALARALERDGREAEARQAFREAAEAGSGAAAFLYGIMADKGQGGAEDDLEAERAYRLARQRGVAAASTALALLYTYSDRATTTDDREILQLLVEAANKGHAPAMYRLGVAYEQGKLNRRFLPIDPDQSQQWYARAYQVFKREADQQRDPTSIRFLSLLYDGGKGTPRNIDLAVRYLAQYLSIAYGPDNTVVRRRGSIGDLSLDEWSLDTRRSFQVFLSQVAGLEGPADGIIGGKSREAIERWLGLRV